MSSATAKLRSGPAEASFFFSPTIDGDLIPDSPHKLLQGGKSARIPFISGNTKDEGVLFIPATIPDDQTIAAFAVAAWEPNGLPQEVLVTLFTELYPSIPALGSPFGTGNETFGLAPVLKQANAMIGDILFQAPRRWFSRQFADQGLVRAWSYAFEAPTILQPALGSKLHPASAAEHRFSRS